jgi:hypothetical protein
MSVAGKPGYLCEFDADGKLKPHATASIPIIPITVLVEDDLQGKTIDDTYAIDDLGRAVIAEPGDIIHFVLKTGQNVANGAYLKSNGDGTVVAGTNANSIAKAIEAVDATAADKFIAAMVI